MDWKQEVLKRLDTLAEKLGTTAAYLWSVLCKQAISDGISSLIWGVLFVIFYVITFSLSNRLRKSKNEDKIVGGWLLFAAAHVIGLSIAVYFMTDAVQHFINPGYYALHEVLQTLGK